MFSSKFVKIDKIEWETIKNDYNALLADNARLKENQSEFLMGIVKKQSDTIKTLTVYQEQDETLYSYEQTLEEQKLKIKELESQLAAAKKESAQYLNAYQKESTMTTLLAGKIASNPCPQYKTVSLDIKA